MVQIGSFYPGIVFSSLFLIIGRLGSWWWYHLLLSYCFSKIIPSFFTIKKGSTFLTKPLFPQGREDVTALRCSEPLRYKVGGPSKVYARFCGMGPPGMVIHIYINTKLQHFIYYQVIYMPNFPNRHNASNRLYHPHYSICDC